MAMRVADMSVDELRTLIQETIGQTLSELLRDPDEGLTLCEDFQSALQRSLETHESGGETIPAASVAARLGLSWSTDPI